MVTYDELQLPTPFPYPRFVAMKVRRVIHLIRDHMDEQAAIKNEEVVGLVRTDNKIIRLINQAHSALRFDIGPVFMQEAIASLPHGISVVAFYHSHPAGDENPSPLDRASMTEQFDAKFQMPWLIVTPENAVLWWMDPIYRTFAGWNVPVTVNA